MSYWVLQIFSKQTYSPRIKDIEDSLKVREPDTLVNKPKISPSIIDTIKETKVVKLAGDIDVKMDNVPEPVVKDTVAVPGELTIEVLPWADVYINDQLLDSHLSLPPDIYSIVFVYPNFQPRINRIDLKEGDRQSIFWSFLSAAGYLWIEVKPWANIYIDGKFIDTTPLSSMFPTASNMPAR